MAIRVVDQEIEKGDQMITEEYRTIELEISRHVATIWLNRPEIRNAFNEVMIGELIHAFEAVNQMDELRAVVLRGRGSVFCAGADLNWMRDVVNYSYEQNYQESYQLSRCFHAIYTCEKPTMALVHGASIGGANGLMAACDFAYCTDDCVFSLSEVKIGVVPACISPYVVKRVGEFPSRDLMLSGRRFEGPEAQSIHLVNRSLPDHPMLLSQMAETLHALMSSGPQAMKMAKTLLYNIANQLTLEKALGDTARMIAQIRSSEEAQEGMAAFLEKRKPRWAD